MGDQRDADPLTQLQRDLEAPLHPEVAGVGEGVPIVGKWRLGDRREELDRHGATLPAPAPAVEPRVDSARHARRECGG